MRCWLLLPSNDKLLPSAKYQMPEGMIAPFLKETAYFPSQNAADLLYFGRAKRTSRCRANLALGLRWLIEGTTLVWSASSFNAG